MELDFSKLNQISNTVSDNSSNSSGEDTGVKRLQKEANNNEADRSRTVAIYREYQQNIKLSGELQTKLIKDAKAGATAEELLPIALTIVSSLIGDRNFLRDEVLKLMKSNS